MARSVLRAKVQNVWQSGRVSRWRHLLAPNRMYRYLTAERRRLPDFIIAGAQKAGTTSLFEYVAAHPCFRAPLAKELAFFDGSYHRGLAWYRQHFPVDDAAGAGDHRRGLSQSQSRFITGESSSYYIFHPLAPQRIATLLPEVKIMIVLRNPVDRAFSHYQHKRRRCQETLAFEEALDAEPDRLAGEEDKICDVPGYKSRVHRLHSYLARGRYLEQLRRWEAHLPPERLLILESSALFKRTAEVYQRVLDFLGLPQWRPAQFAQHFAGGYREKMSDATRRRLIDYFAPHNEQLYAHLGTRFDWDR